MSVEKKKRLVSILAKYQVPLIEDDIYGDLCPPGDRRPVTAKAFDTEGLVLLCSSFSKTLAPGLRVGWIAPGRFREQILRLKTNQTLACPTITQLAVAEFLEHGSYDAHLRKIRTIFRQPIADSSAARFHDIFHPESESPGHKAALFYGSSSRQNSTPPHSPPAPSANIGSPSHPDASSLPTEKTSATACASAAGIPWSARMEQAIRNPRHPGKAIGTCQCLWEKRERCMAVDSETLSASSCWRANR